MCQRISQQEEYPTLLFVLDNDQRQVEVIRAVDGMKGKHLKTSLGRESKSRTGREKKDQDARGKLHQEGKNMKEGKKNVLSDFFGVKVSEGNMNFFDCEFRLREKK